MVDKRANKGRRKEAPSGETSAERFARRYPNGAPFGPKPEGFLGRHLFGTLVLALLAALTITTSLAIMNPEPKTPEGFTFTQCGGDAECSAFEAAGYAPFTTEGFPCAEDELLGYAAPEAGTSPDGIACLHIDLLENNAIMDALAFCENAGGTLIGFDYGSTDKPICKETEAARKPLPTPCGPPTLPGCGVAPTPRPDLGRTAALCQEVSALMRTLVQGFDPDGETPSGTLLRKVGKVNGPICTAKVGADAHAICLATQAAVNDVLARFEDEPNVWTQNQAALLRQAADVVCEGATAVAPSAPTPVPVAQGGNADALPLPEGTTVVVGTTTTPCASDGTCYPYNFYWAPTHEAILLPGTPDNVRQHELCHAHQHYSINGGAPLAPSDYDLGSWYASAEGASYMGAIAGLPALEDLYARATVNGIEDNGWTCAYWYTDPQHLLTVSPERYAWAQANLP